MPIARGENLKTATEKVLCMEWVPLSKAALCLDCESLLPDRLAMPAVRIAGVRAPEHVSQGKDGVTWRR